MVRRSAVEVGVWDLEVARDERLKHDLGCGDASNGQCALSGAVVRNRPADNLVTRWLACELEVPAAECYTLWRCTSACRRTV